MAALGGRKAMKVVRTIFCKSSQAPISTSFIYATCAEIVLPKNSY